MQENRQQKPISPKDMFFRLLQQSFKQAQCESESQKINKKKIILTQLIQQYEKSIYSQIVKINQLSNLEKLKLQKVQELSRLKKQRQIIQNSVHQQLTNITITPNQHQEKLKLTQELQEVQCVNNQIKIKLKDLHSYIHKLEIHNQRLISEKDIIQTKLANRLRVDSTDWNFNIEALRKKNQLQENNIKTKILEKQSENIKNIRKQQEQIYKRNQQKWDQFRKTAFKPNLIKSYNQGINKDSSYKEGRNISHSFKQGSNFFSRQGGRFESMKQPQKVFKNFRVI